MTNLYPLEVDRSGKKRIAANQVNIWNVVFR